MDVDDKTVMEETVDEISNEMDTDATAADPTANAITDRDAGSSAHKGPVGEPDATAAHHTANTITDRDAGSSIQKGPVGESDEAGAIEDRKMNPVQGSHPTFTTAIYVSGLVEELVKTFASADHGEYLANEVDKISDDTQYFPANLIESIYNQKAETKPFNLLGCPDNVIQQIFRCVLVSNEPIKPYWNFGALAAHDEKPDKENYTTMVAALAGNKKLVDEATTILYSENTFDLQHAKVALWWLKRIGPSNVSKIKRLKISVEEGEMDKVFGTRFETLWCSIFLLLQAQHKFQELEVSFANWTNPDGSSPSHPIYVWEPRVAVIRTLLSFRGLHRAIIVPGPFLPEWYADVIQDALVMSQGQTNADVLDLERTVRGPQRSRYSF